jgi:type 1 glutamine amidotransferase
MLPKFLLADNSQEAPDTIYVVHTEEPRFIVESDVEDFWENQVIYWIDDDPQNEELISQLLEEAEDFLEDEFDNQEDLYDEDINNN